VSLKMPTTTRKLIVLTKGEWWSPIMITLDESIITIKLDEWFILYAIILYVLFSIWFTGGKICNLKRRQLKDRIERLKWVVGLFALEGIFEYKYYTRKVIGEEVLDMYLIGAFLVHIYLSWNHIYQYFGPGWTLVILFSICYLQFGFLFQFVHLIPWRANEMFYFWTNGIITQILLYWGIFREKPAIAMPLSIWSVICLLISYSTWFLFFTMYVFYMAILINK